MCPWINQAIPKYLSISEVHVWKTDLDHHHDQLEKYWRYLSGDERARADRFKNPVHRSRFIVGRALLKELLGGYINLDPELVTIAYGPYGKPTLKEEQNPDQIQFNLSHANELALYAFSIDRKLGIDLEFIHWIPDFDRIAARSFSKNEYRIWDALPDAVKKLAFYRCWTRKEAFVKAVGDGFSFPLDQFEVSLCPGEPPQLIRIETAPFEAARWSYGELPGIPGCTTALIVEENDWNLACFDHQL